MPKFQIDFGKKPLIFEPVHFLRSKEIFYG